MRDRRENDDPLAGHLFWSRRGGRDLSAEVDFDRPCHVCGYNLRGMPLKSRCPECGSLAGWNLFEEPVAWDEQQTLRAFVSTCIIAIFNPHRLARHVWRQQRMDLAAARRFRRIALTIASGSLWFVAFVITMRTTNPLTALISLPFQLVPIVVWLNAVTLESLSRMKGWSTNAAITRRMHAIAHYASASLVLSPVHIPVVLMTGDIPPALAAAIHVAILMFQLIIAALPLGWLLFELVDMPKFQAHTLALGPVLTATATAVVILIAVPAMIALLASRFVPN